MCQTTSFSLWRWILLVSTAIIFDFKDIFSIGGKDGQVSGDIYESYFCSMHQSLKLILFGVTLHVSDDLSVHHQEFQTVHTATATCQTDTAVWLLTSRQQYLFDKRLSQYVQSGTPDDGREDRPKHVECYSK